MVARVISAGDRFGRLTVVGEEPRLPGGRRVRCVCDCGIERVVYLSNLVDGSTTSCGCFASETTRARHAARPRRERPVREPLFAVWKAMHARCRNPRNAAYAGYGGRGITVCDEWFDYPVFKAWAEANGYDPNLQIDRTDNDGPYCPGNCRWVTSQENNRNRRDNHLISAFGKTQCLAAWVEDARCVVPDSVLSDRVRRGWGAERALTTPSARVDPTRITAFGETKTFDAWAADDRCGVSLPQTLSNRVKLLGWDVERAITTPARDRRSPVQQ